MREAIQHAKTQKKTSVIVVETDYHDRVPGHESWWDVPIAEVSEEESVRAAYLKNEKAKQCERHFWPGKQNLT